MYDGRGVTCGTQVSSAGVGQPVTDQFVLKVVADRPQSSYGRGYTRTDDNTTSTTTTEVLCPSVSSLTTATLVLDADVDWLTSAERVQLLRDLAAEFQLPTQLFRLRAPPNDRPLMDVDSALAAGPGDLGAARPRHAGLLVQWDVGCGNVRAELMASLELLETAAGDGRLRAVVGRPVVGWYVANSRRGGRRGGDQKPAWPPQPTATPLPPTALPPTWRPDLPTATVTLVEPTATISPSPSPSVTVQRYTHEDFTSSQPHGTAPPTTRLFSVLSAVLV